MIKSLLPKKNYTRSLWVGLACCMALPVLAQQADRSLKEKKRTEIASFFDRRMTDETTVFTSSIRMKLKETETYRKAVWQLWKEANEAYKEDKLPQPTPLSEASAGHWNLPEELEPKAVLNFYWGRKEKAGTPAPAEGWPLFLYLHGSGPKAQEWATGLKICSRFDDAPSLYFIPQIPNEGAYYRWYQRSKQYAWEKLLRQALLSDEINPNRIYLFGISEGGYGSQRLASFYADYWAGAGPMAGGEPLKNAPAENLGNTAFSLRTGAEDKGFYRDRLTGYTAAALDSLQQLYPNRYTHWIELIPGRGHHIDYAPTTPWLKQYIRNPYPKHFIWENFEMDGRYRTGFYNLRVDERSNTDTNTRTRYELDIEGNQVSLKVDEVTYRTIEKDPKWGIELKFAKTYTPASRGKVTVYLCPELVDLSKPVTLTVNGHTVFQGRVKPDVKHLVNSCATFFDPQRLYPAALEVDLATLEKNR